MISKKQVENTLESYDKPKIGTICSHSALQIFKGAKDEGFKTIGMCHPGRKSVYEAFKMAKPDEFIIMDEFKNILNSEVQEKLIEEQVILIPHGSFVEYVGADNILEKLKVPMFGNRMVLEWEASREKQRKWLEGAGINMPRKYESPDEIDSLAIVKFGGARGGRGFFRVKTAGEYYDEIRKRKKRGSITKEQEERLTIQEYIVGTRYYNHFFYSPLNDGGFKAGNGTLELMSIDRRDESNIDEIPRLGFTLPELKMSGVELSYTVTGNVPIILRESLLPKVFADGKKAVEKSVELFPPGMVGPFCLETICDSNTEFITFEISARIVAGTNIFVSGSPYSDLAYGSGMSTGKRIALEVKKGLETNRLTEVVH